MVDQRAALARLVVAVEPAAGQVDRAGLAARVGAAVAARIGIGCQVVVVGPGGLPRTEVGKARRVIRWDGGDPPVPGLE